MNTPKSKRFQSGREIFEEFIPDYEANDTEFEDVSSQADQFVDAVLCDFKTRVPEPSRMRTSRGK